MQKGESIIKKQTLDAMAGHALYMQFNQCVVLTEQCRQTCASLYRILTNVRNEVFSVEDYQILEKRLLQYHVATAPKDMTYIVTRNDLKQKLNEVLIQKFASDNKAETLNVQAIDIYQRNIVGGVLKNSIAGLDDSKTSRLVEQLKLVPGCPVLITQNIATGNFK
jgi:hypothetical protein